MRIWYSIAVLIFHLLSIWPILPANANQDNNYRSYYITDQYGDFLNASFDDFIKQSDTVTSPLGSATEDVSFEEGKTLFIVAGILFALLFLLTLRDWRELIRFGAPEGQRDIAVSDAPERRAGILQSYFITGGKLSITFCLCYGFLVLRGFADLYIALADDSALNFLIASVMLIATLSLLPHKTRPYFFLIAGGVLMARGTINAIMAASYLDAATLAALPLSALPSLFIAYLLPLGIGLYFLATWFSRRRGSVQAVTGSSDKPDSRADC